MKHIFLLVLFSLSYQLVAQDFVQVEKGTIDLEKYNPKLKDGQKTTIDVKEFEASPLVSCNDYWEFYQSIQEIFGTMAAKSLLPELSVFNGMPNPKESLMNYVYSFKGNNNPIIGVSWSNSVRYCGWKWAQSEGVNSDYKYRLPLLSEWLLIIDNSNNDYAEWSMNIRDDSYLELGTYNPNYQYNALPTDPPSMKQKLVVGSSHLSKSKGPFEDMRYSYYQDSGYRHVGFRMIRVPLSDKERALKKASSNVAYTPYPNLYLFAEKKSGEISDLNVNDLSVSFSEYKGRLHGNYQSSYKNGKTKAEGTYVYGVKTGVWKYYNQNGEKVFEEKYLDHLAPFNNEYASFEDPILQELNKYPYHMPKRNDKGFVDYFYLKERAYIWSRRQWCKIEPENNDMMFGADRLFSVINDLAQDESIVIYDSTDDQFTKQLNAEDFKKRVNSSTKVAYYEIKEDFFFDNDRYTSEHRIITLTPFVVSEGINDGKPYKLCHLYYPELREHLAKHPVNTYNLRITNLDDIFYFRDFDYSVVGTSSIYGRRSKSINVNNRFEERIKAIEQAHSVLIELK